MARALATRSPGMCSKDQKELPGLPEGDVRVTYNQVENVIAPGSFVRGRRSRSELGFADVHAALA